VTDKELDDIRRVASMATPGPWSWHSGADYDFTIRCELDGRRLATVEASNSQTREANARFIAQAPEIVELLLAEIDRLRATQ
jgi:hypothetical protein